MAKRQVWMQGVWDDSVCVVHKVCVCGVLRTKPIACSILANKASDIDSGFNVTYSFCWDNDTFVHQLHSVAVHALGRAALRMSTDQHWLAKPHSGPSPWSVSTPGPLLPPPSWPPAVPAAPTAPGPVSPQDRALLLPGLHRQRAAWLPALHVQPDHEHTETASDR